MPSPAPAGLGVVDYGCRQRTCDAATIEIQKEGRFIRQGREEGAPNESTLKRAGQRTREPGLNLIRTPPTKQEQINFVSFDFGSSNNDPIISAKSLVEVHKGIRTLFPHAATTRAPQGASPIPLSHKRALRCPFSQVSPSTSRLLLRIISAE
jgi:hypothetical protein